MSFHFVDRILYLEPGKRAVGLKHVTPSDIYIEEIIPGKPALMPGVIGEAVGQLASWCVKVATNFEMIPVSGIIGEVLVFGSAKIGDTVLLSIEIDSYDDEAVQYSGVATVRDEVILKIECAVAPFLPTSKLNDVNQVKNLFGQISKQDFQSFNFKNETNDHLLNRFSLSQLNYDGVFFSEPGKCVVASKKVSISSPFFREHFPLKPVFPLSLLLQCKMDLLRQFLHEMLGFSPDIKKIHLKNIKMRQFIEPDVIFIIRLDCVNSSEGCSCLKFTTEFNQKRICTVNVECYYETT